MSVTVSVSAEAGEEGAAGRVAEVNARRTAAARARGTAKRVGRVGRRMGEGGEL
jgi:hypothetical protein